SPAPHPHPLRSVRSVGAYSRPQVGGFYLSRAHARARARNGGPPPPLEPIRVTGPTGRGVRATSDHACRSSCHIPCRAGPPPTPFDHQVGAGPLVGPPPRRAA